MFPLAAIPSALPGFTPRSEGVSAETLPFPKAMDIGSVPSLPGARPETVSPTTSSGESFTSLLGQFVSEVNDRQNTAAASVAGLQSGGPVQLHQAVIAMEEAGVSFQLMVEVRNKLLEAYQELMRMQI
jgi:flagellar hook-basal body complex protein FliE